MSFVALFAVWALGVKVKVAAKSLLIGLYIVPSILLLSLDSVILLVVLLWLVLMVIVAILASIVVPSFRSPLMMRALIIVISPPVVICDFLNRMVVVAIVGGQELASGTEFAGLFLLLDLLHVYSCIIIMKFINEEMFI